MPEETPELTTVGLGRAFEEEVASFLSEKMGFKDVKKNIHIASSGQKNEVDVCGRFGEVLFVFWCTAAGRKTKRNLREKALGSIQRAKIVRDNYKCIPEYTSCKFVRFVFITKKITITNGEEYILDEGIPKVIYSDEYMLEYYSDLYEKIGNYAVYNFLSDFGIQPDNNEKVSFIDTCITNVLYYGLEVHYAPFWQPAAIGTTTYAGGRFVPKRIPAC